MKQIALADVQAAVRSILEILCFPPPRSGKPMKRDVSKPMKRDVSCEAHPYRQILGARRYPDGNSPFARLKTRWPDSHIAWIVDELFADILRGNPLIDEVIAFPSGSWRRDWRYGRLFPYLKRSLALRRQLKAGHYDVLVSLTAKNGGRRGF